MKGKRAKIAIIGGFGLVVVGVVLWGLFRTGEQYIETPEDTQTIEYLYGIDKGNYTIEQGTVESGQTLSTILLPFGVGATLVDQIARKMEPVFSVKNIRAGHNFTAFMVEASDSTRTLEHFVYEQSVTQYVVITIEGDSVDVKTQSKPVRVERIKRTATIESSLWNSMASAGMSPGLAMDLSDIYAWSIDFFGLQKGDKFTVIYEERFVDTLSVGVGRIWGAEFLHNGKTYYAIPFNQGGKITYWDEQGNSLRKSLLKAPLKFSRISSRFSNSRLHPVLKIRRPHHGVDYAAPSGTPVVAVADGVVTSRGWGGGGGNTVKIQHSGNLSTSYLHLKGYGPGIATGKRVNQGQLIGYVGSTGLSTGPHLDFRLYRSGKAIDPLSVISPPAEPISKANQQKFALVKERILGELAGTLADSLVVTNLDSLFIKKTVVDTVSTAVKR